MNDVIVGMCDLAVTTDRDATLVTYSLGSCLGISLFDAEAGVGGLLHCMLPLSQTHPEKAKANPAMFTDTGFMMLLNQVLDAGASKSRLSVKIAGGGAPMDSAGRFKIGQRNLAVARKLLWKNDLLIEESDVGGTRPRTMRLILEDGKVLISTGREVVTL